MNFIQNALLIYDDTDSPYISLLEDNEIGTITKNIHVDKFLKAAGRYKLYADHILISCNDEYIDKIFQLAVEENYSISFLPASKQKELIRTYNLSNNFQENIEIALNEQKEKVDLIYCDGDYFHSKIYFGKIPFIHDYSATDTLFTRFISATKQLFKIKLSSYDIKTANGSTIKTALSGLLISNHSQDSNRLNYIFKETSMRNGKLSMATISPSSVLEYFSLFFYFLFYRKKLSNAVSFLRSDSFEILHNGISKKYEIKKNALCINAGDKFWENNPKSSDIKDSAKITNLPDEKERVKYIQKHIPFFSVASPERFKELFSILRDDSKINTQYISLMLLSTMLAAIGLFANSTAVVIGAMVLAPLMTPIVSFSMGILRGENDMIKNALFKITIGIVLSILASALMAIILPQTNLTHELTSRINPTLLDLGVAIFAGIAAAYSKSHKSIRDSLAGVAIAVALVPPLATAGIGLGRGEFYVFSGAFLLFFTNLVGISLAATITFQFLGFSNAIKSKKSLIAITVILFSISYPLYLSYDKILKAYKLNTYLKKTRYLVGSKYIIIKSANILHADNIDVIDLRLVLRDGLTRHELKILKDKIQKSFEKKVYLRIETEFII